MKLFFHRTSVDLLHLKSKGVRTNVGLYSSQLLHSVNGLLYTPYLVCVNHEHALISNHITGNFKPSLVVFDIAANFELKFIHASCKILPNQFNHPIIRKA